MNSQIAVVGHRGWPSRFPDNTLSGLMAASAVADAVEVDVRRSADGRLVLAHDPVIGNLVVAETPWPSLSEVDLGDRAKPCLLDEAVASLPDTQLLIEIKNLPGEPGFEPDHRIALEAASRTRDGDVIISFNWASVDAVVRSGSGVATGLIVGPVGNLGDAVEHCIEFGHQYVIAEASHVVGSQPDVPAGLRLYVWSDHPGDTYQGVVEELVSSGATGIITDDPGHTRSLLGRADEHQG